MNAIDFSSPCPKCGNTGLHACTGHMPEPMTDRERHWERQALQNAVKVMQLTEANVALLRRVDELEKFKGAWKDALVSELVKAFRKRGDALVLAKLEAQIAANEISDALSLAIYQEERK